MILQFSGKFNCFFRSFLMFCIFHKVAGGILVRFSSTSCCFTQQKRLLTVRTMALSQKKQSVRRLVRPRRLTGAFANMKMGGGKPPPIGGKRRKSYLPSLAAFHSAILARTSLLMFQMKVKQLQEPRAAIRGKPRTISLMP